MYFHFLIDFFVLLFLVQNVLRKKIFIRWFALLIHILGASFIYYASYVILPDTTISQLDTILIFFWLLECIGSIILSYQSGLLVKKEEGNVIC